MWFCLHRLLNMELMSSATSTTVHRVQALLKINKRVHPLIIYLPGAKFQFPAGSNFMLEFNVAKLK